MVDMYEKYWNLREAPFVNSYNPRLLYLSSQFEEGVARLFYLVSEGRVAGVLTGRFGMGKSFLLSNLTERIAQAGIPYIRIDAIPKGHLALLRHVIAGLGVKGTVASIADGLMTLQELSRKPGALKRHAILIDEAQYLGDDDGLYLIHYLTNLRLTSSDGREQQLATVIMAGIPELLDMVRSYQSLRARVQLTWTLAPLTHSETIEFVQHKIMAAGGDMWIFNHEALSELYRLSGGVPRSITNICDTALMLGYVVKAPEIDAAIVRQAAEDVDILPKEEG
jgi:general secretion pathway protein A